MKTLYVRKKGRIETPTGELVYGATSHNKAKKWSRKKQMEIDHALGRGSVRVDK